MPDASTWGAYPIPTEPEAAELPADLMALVEAMDPHTVHFATSQANRDTLYSGIPAGALVSCASLKTTWRSLGGSTWERVTYDSGWVTTGFTYPSAGWVAGSYSRVRNRNGVIEVSVAVLRSGADVTASSVGDLTNVAIVALPANYWPSGSARFAGAYVGTAGGTVYVGTDGVAVLADTLPNNVITSGSQVQFSGTWLEG